MKNEREKHANMRRIRRMCLCDFKHGPSGFGFVEPLQIVFQQRSELLEQKDLQHYGVAFAIRLAPQRVCLQRDRLSMMEGENYA